MARASIDSIAKAEKILNRTLAYQAAIAVHDINDALELDVTELGLVVAPQSPEAPGCYRVTCTIESLGAGEPVTVDVLIRPEQAILPIGKGSRVTAGRQQAKPTPRGRARRPRN